MDEDLPPSLRGTAGADSDVPPSLRKSAAPTTPAVAAPASAAAAPAAPPAEDDSLRSRAERTPALGALEAALHMGTGMVAKPVSDVAGLAAMASDVVTGEHEGNAEGFKKSVQESLTYQPRTRTGRAVAEYNPLALAGKGIDWLGSKVENLIAPKGASTEQKMLAAGVREAINQAPQFIAAKAPELGSAVERALKGVARNTMQSALKPTPQAMMTGRGQRAIDTMLDEGINVSRGGVEKMQTRIHELNNEITDRIANSTAVVNKQAVGWRLQEVLDDFAKQVDATADLASIQRVWDRFLDHPLLTSSDIPVQLAQDLKKGTYKSLGEKAYGELKGSEIEAQKALARGLKEDIAAAVPEVRPLNAQETRLLDALSVSERRVLMDANKNPFGLGWLTTSPTKFAGWMADRSPLFKSLVARMLNAGSEAAPGVAKTLPAAGMVTSQAAGEHKLKAPPAAARP